MLEQGILNNPVDWKFVKECDDSQIVLRGYTQPQLENIFNAIQNPVDWKAPICALISANLIDIAHAAIQWYTATDAKVEYDSGRAMWRISSKGYRLGPAGDH